MTPIPTNTTEDLVDSGRSLRVFAALFVTALALAAPLYWRVYLNGYPGWPANDDGHMFSEIANLKDGTYSFVEYLLTAHSDSLIPLLRLVYLAGASTTSAWPAPWDIFGYAYVALYAFSTAATGFVVWYFGRNVLVAVSVVALIVPSQIWSVGVISIFHYSGFYIILSATALALPLLFSYLRRPASLAPLAILLALSASAFAPGLFLAPVLVC